MFDEEPPGDPHDECRFEIERLQAENAALTGIVKEYVLQHDAMSDNWAAVEDAPPEPCPCPLCKRARAALAPKEDGDG